MAFSFRSVMDFAALCSFACYIGNMGTNLLNLPFLFHFFTDVYEQPYFLLVLPHASLQFVFLAFLFYWTVSAWYEMGLAAMTKFRF